MDNISPFIEFDDNLALPLLIPEVTPSITYELQLKVTFSDNQVDTLTAWIGSPIDPESLISLSKILTVNNSGWDCAAALIGLTLDLLGLIPGASCSISLASYLTGMISNIVTLLSDQGALSITQYLYTQIIGGMKTIAACSGEVLPHGVILDAIQIALSRARAEKECGEYFGKGDESELPVDRVQAIDPNEIIGPLGIGDSRYISIKEPTKYAIYFENLASSTGAAQEVIITDTLNTTQYDLESFSFGPINIGSNFVYAPAPGTKSFSQTFIMENNDESTLKRFPIC